MEDIVRYSSIRKYLVLETHLFFKKKETSSVYKISYGVYRKISNCNALYHCNQGTFILLHGWHSRRGSDITSVSGSPQLRYRFYLRVEIYTLEKCDACIRKIFSKFIEKVR